MARVQTRVHRDFPSASRRRSNANYHVDLSLSRISRLAGSLCRCMREFARTRLDNRSCVRSRRSLEAVRKSRISLRSPRNGNCIHGGVDAAGKAIPYIFRNIKLRSDSRERVEFSAWWNVGRVFCRTTTLLFLREDRPARAMLGRIANWIR